MRKLILAVLVVLPALCHANSVQIGTRTYIGNIQTTITVPWLAGFRGMPSYTVSSPSAENSFVNTGTELRHDCGRTENVMLFQMGNMRSINVTAVPESGTLILLGTGMLGVGFILRRRWNGQNSNRSKSRSVEVPLAASTRARAVASVDSRNSECTSADAALKEHDCAA